MKILLINTFLLITFFSFSQENENHVFIDNMVGYGIHNEHFPSSTIEIRSFFSTNINLGNKFYFGDSEKLYQPGFVVTWFKLGINIPTNATVFSTTTNFSLANVGFINMFNLSENMSLEVDLNVGLNTYSKYYLLIPSPKLGFEFSPKVQFHFNKINIGYSYSITKDFSSNPKVSFFDYNLHSLVIGFKI